MLEKLIVCYLAVQILFCVVALAAFFVFLGFCRRRGEKESCCRYCRRPARDEDLALSALLFTDSAGEPRYPDEALYAVETRFGSGSKEALAVKRIAGDFARGRRV